MSCICLLPGCTDDIFTSDHSPVFATFEVGVLSPLTAKTGPGGIIGLSWVESLAYANSPVAYLCGTDVTRGVERAWIELEGIEAIVKTASKAKFFIEFHSSCLEGRREKKAFSLKFPLVAQQPKTELMALFVETRRSSENDSQSCDIPRFLKLGWSFKQLPKVRRPLVNMCSRWLESSVDFVSPRLSQLLPVMSDLEYLQDQHLLLSVKSCDGFESYGSSH